MFASLEVCTTSRSALADLLARMYFWTRPSLSRSLVGRHPCWTAACFLPCTRPPDLPRLRLRRPTRRPGPFRTRHPPRARRNAPPSQCRLHQRGALRPPRHLPVDRCAARWARCALSTSRNEDCCRTASECSADWIPALAALACWRGIPCWSTSDGCAFRRADPRHAPQHLAERAVVPSSALLRLRLGSRNARRGSAQRGDLRNLNFNCSDACGGGSPLGRPRREGCTFNARLRMLTHQRLAISS